MIFSFIGVSLLTLAVAIPMAEMCSMYPVAGGQYSWVAALTPTKYARGLSYVTGWFMLIGMFCYIDNMHDKHLFKLTQLRSPCNGSDKQLYCLEFCTRHG